MTIRKKDLTAICEALKDGFAAAEAITVDGTKDWLFTEGEKADLKKHQVKRLHIYHDLARDVAKVLSKHNGPTFDEDRFIKACMPRVVK